MRMRNWDDSVHFDLRAILFRSVYNLSCSWTRSSNPPRGFFVFFFFICGSSVGSARLGFRGCSLDLVAACVVLPLVVEGPVVLVVLAAVSLFLWPL